MKPLPMACAFCLVALVACGGQGLEDVERYVAELEAGSEQAVAPLPEFPQPVPTVYQAGSGRNPFEPPRMGGEQSVVRGTGGLSPDFSRAKQPLEAFPTSALGMVGTVANGAVRRGLVVDEDGQVHQVGAGDYLGENHGRVRWVGEDALEFVEVLPDGGGGWVERNRSLMLAPPAP